MSKDNYQSLKEKGNDYFRTKKYEEALKCYTSAIAVKKDEPVLYSNRAICFINLKRYFEAKEDCDEAIQLDSKMIKAYYRRAFASRNLYRYQSAVEDLKMVVKLDSSFTMASKEIKVIEQILAGDKRIDLKSHEKPENLRDKKPMKCFDLKNQYSGSFLYTNGDDCRILN